jgi:DNA repair photolyase
MSEYTTPLSITSQFAFCGLPLRLDSYRGCGFRCSYCFARYRGGNKPSEKILPADATLVTRTLRRALESGGHGLIAEFLRRRTPIHFGGMSDPLQPAEKRHGVTATLLRNLAQYNYPTVLSTRSPMVVEEPYLSLLMSMGHVVVQFSFSSTRDDIAAKVEPESTRPSVLLRTMNLLARRGVIVTCRWQPYLPGISEDASEFVSRVAATGCRHISFEHLKVPLEQNNSLWRQFTRNVGQDVAGAYRLREARRDGRELVLPAHEKLSLILKTRTVVQKAGLTFGAADNEFQFLSDTHCCCSGVDQFPGFEGWFQHQIAAAVRRAYTQKTLVTYDLIAAEWQPRAPFDRQLNSRSRLTVISESGGRLSDHIRTRWNRSDSPGSPATFFGVVAHSRCDSNGLATYAWDPAALCQLPSEDG